MSPSAPVPRDLPSERPSEYQAIRAILIRWSVPAQQIKDYFADCPDS